MAKNRKVRVAVNGYGVIGKRVADAVSLQEDMELVGVSDVTYDYRMRVAAEKGYPIYASVPEKRGEMEQAHIPVSGTLDDLLEQVDVVVDCTPKGIGARNKPVYEQAGVKAIFQGGEKHELTGYSFTAQVNYADAPADSVLIWVMKKFKSAKLLTPDRGPMDVPVKISGARTEINVPPIAVYGALLLE